MGFRNQLEALLAARGYTLDEAQRAAADRLARLDDDWRAYKVLRTNAGSRSFSVLPRPMSTPALA